LIGRSQHVDLELDLKNFEDKSEIPASGTRVVIFTSAPTSSFPESSRTLINRYWNGQNSSQLLLQDIYGNTYTSRYSVFADGLYRKHIYERLAHEANKNLESDPMFGD
jgi:hypothetical protein